MDSLVSRFVFCYLFFFVNTLNLISKDTSKKKNLKNQTNKDVVKKEDSKKNVDDNNLDSNIKNVKSVDAKITTEDIKELERFGDDVKKKKAGHLSDLMFLDTDELKDIFEDEDILLSQGNRLPSLSDLIPVSFSSYMSFFNFNLSCSKGDDYFYKGIFNFNYATVVTYKLKSLHKYIWNKFLEKKPENKALIYIRDHFEPKVGLYFEYGSYSNYYPYKIGNQGDDDDKLKKTETTVKIPLLRIGPCVQMTWIKDDTGMINSSIIFSFGWQTNLYKNGCSCFHHKDIWVDLETDQYGVNDLGVLKCTKVFRDFNLKSYYLLINLDFGFYFIKVFARFYSPIASKSTSSIKFMDQFYSDNVLYKDIKSNIKFDKDISKLFNFDSWTLTFGVSLAF